jgi:REP-associated tyrosine transposase
MVIAHHVMWTLYGWWLPNDPRGSTSHTIRCDPLKDLGELHFGRRRMQPAGRDLRLFYEQAAGRLQHDLLSFTPNEFPIVAHAFDNAIRLCGYTCYALAIMPDHVHLLIRKHKDLAETMIGKLQEQTRIELNESGVRGPGHPVWAQGGYKVFLDTPEDVWRTLGYIEQNPVKQRLPVQRWPFLTPYDNWPQHKKR